MEHGNGWCFRGIYKGGLWEDDLHVSAQEFHLFDTPISLSLAGSVNQLWSVAYMLALFKGPLVHAWSTPTS